MGIFEFTEEGGEMNAVKRRHNVGLLNFYSKIKATDGCWEWQAFRNPKGYGMWSYKGKPWLAHRFAYQIAVGDLEEGLVIDHLCRNRACVRPDHLEQVKQAVNCKRGEVATKTHCRQGHSLADAFIRTHKSGPQAGYTRRLCRQCAYAGWRKYYYRRKSKGGW